MMFAAGLLVLALLYFRPDLPLSRMVRRALVEAPAELLQRRPLLLAARILAVLAITAMAIGAPELLLVFGLADVAMLMELAMIVMLLSSVARLKLVGSAIRSAAASARAVLTAPLSRMGRPRARRIRVIRFKPPRRVDDEDRTAWAFA